MSKASTPGAHHALKIEQLLRSLNEWVTLRQAPPGDVPLDDTGEFNGRVRTLIEELAGLGQAVTLRDGRYVPVSVSMPDAGAKP